MPKIKPKDSIIRKADPDFYFEHLYENKNKTLIRLNKYTFKPEEVERMQKNHDYWQDVRLKA